MSIELIDVCEIVKSDCAPRVELHSALQEDGKPLCRPSRWWSAHMRCLALFGC